MLHSNSVITIADKAALTTRRPKRKTDAISRHCDSNVGEKSGDKNDKYLVFRFATGGSHLYNIRAVLDFSTEDGWNNPTDSSIDHYIFDLQDENAGYTELIGVHELSFPFEKRASKDKSDVKLRELYEEPSNYIGSDKANELFAKLRIIAHTANGYPVNASRIFDLFGIKNGEKEVIEGEFKPTLGILNHIFKGQIRYHFKYFNVIDRLTDLTASGSLTYGKTLKVTFTPKSGDDVIASGTATLKLGDTVLAT